MKKVIRNIVLFVFSIMFSTAVLAEVPKLISYSGKLTDKAGNLVANSNYDMTFRLYASETGGTLLWSEDQTVPIRNGAYNIFLGSINPEFPDFNKNYWLEVVFKGEPFGRQQIVTTPYAMRADYANHVTTPQVHSGQRDITEYSSGSFYVLLTGVPKVITLSLHLKKFDEIYYREIAYHEHAVSASGTTANDSPPHQHALRVDTGYGHGGSGWHVLVSGGTDHMTNGWVGDNNSNHAHDFSFSTTAQATGGNLGYPALKGGYTAKIYLSELRIKLNGVDITSTVESRAQLAGQITGHIDTTNALKVNVEDLNWIIGENSIDLYQSAVGGGKVIYDVYIWY